MGALLVAIGAGCCGLLAIAPSSTQVLGAVTNRLARGAVRGRMRGRAPFAPARAGSQGVGHTPAINRPPCGRPVARRTVAAAGLARHADGVERRARRVRAPARARYSARRTWRRVRAVGRLTAQLQLAPSRYATGPERVAAMDASLDRMAAIPASCSPATTNRSRRLCLCDQRRHRESRRPMAPATRCSSAASAPAILPSAIRLRQGRVFERHYSLASPQPRSSSGRSRIDTGRALSHRRRLKRRLGMDDRGPASWTT